VSDKRFSVAVEVNGIRCTGEVPARLSLVDFLRDELRLTGTHVGCEHGICDRASCSPCRLTVIA
jgi:aerobic-type carbon monoxide dehydrogenase small subunit (CoxS/CutS family)